MPEQQRDQLEARISETERQLARVGVELGRVVETLGKFETVIQRLAERGRPNWFAIIGATIGVLSLMCTMCGGLVLISTWFLAQTVNPLTERVNHLGGEITQLREVDARLLENDRFSALDRRDLDVRTARLETALELHQGSAGRAKGASASP